MQQQVSYWSLCCGTFFCLASLMFWTSCSSPVASTDGSNPGLPLASPSAAAFVVPLVPPGYVYYHDVVVGTGGSREIRMEICAPASDPGYSLPVVAYIHGGGWNSGSKDASAASIAKYPERGYVGVSMQYRLTSEAGNSGMPAQIEDIKLGIRYLKQHAAQYFINPEKIALWGVSAGAHLAALAGTSAGVSELEGSGGWTGVSSRVAAVVDNYGPTDFTDPLMDTSSSVIALLGGKPSENPAKALAAMPASYADVTDPPFLIMHGTNDSTVPYAHSVSLKNALVGAGVTVSFALVPGAGHGLSGYSLTNGVLASDYAWSFLDYHLRGVGTVPVDPPLPTPSPTPSVTPTPTPAASGAPISEWKFDTTTPVVDACAQDGLASSGAAAQLATISGVQGNAVSLTQSAAGGTGVYYKGGLTGVNRYNLTNGFTWEFLVKSSNDSTRMTSDVVLADFNASTTGYKLLLKSGSFQPKANFYSGSTTAVSVTASSALVANTWTLVTFVYNPLASGSELSIYLNGVLDTSGPMPTCFAANTADQLLILGGANTASKNLDGAADNVAVFDTALSAAAIASRAQLFGF